MSKLQKKWLLKKEIIKFYYLDSCSNILSMLLEMNRRKFLSLGFGCCGLILNSCSTAPITERRQLKIIPEAKLNLQLQKYTKKLKKRKIDKRFEIR